MIKIDKIYTVLKSSIDCHSLIGAKNSRTPKKKKNKQQNTDKGTEPSNSWFNTLI